METRAPFTRNLPLERLPRPLIVISQKGELFLDGLPITTGNLLRQIGEAAGQEKHKFKRLNILADGKLSAREFLKMTGRLRKTGLPIRIVTVRSIDKNQE